MERDYSITFKQRVKRIIKGIAARVTNKVIPFTIVSTSSMTAKCPGYLIPICELKTSKKRYVLGRKIKNVYTII